MKKWIALILVFLLALTLFPALSAKAQAGSVISLGEESAVYPGSDVKFIAQGDEGVYALVYHQNKSLLFFSRNDGTSWQRVSCRGLPEQEKFIAFRVLPGRPDILALATPIGVYLSRDAGNRFEYLGGPTNLAERGEQITSLDVAQGDPPRLLVGVWHPAREKFPLEGVYLWGMGGKRSWTEQGLRTTWQGRGYSADVTSVAFLDSFILALAVGDPDRDGPLPEGTYLNFGYPSEQADARGGEWNWISGWPVEISSQAGNSPNEKEILNSQLVLPAGLSLDKMEEWEFFILFNSLDKGKDGVYRVTIEDVAGRPKVRRLEMPAHPPLVSLDSLACSQKLLAVGVTLQEKGKNQTRVYFFENGKDISFLRGLPDTHASQILLKEGIVFVGTSGKNSSFSRSEDGFLFPVSLMDIPGNIRQVSVSPHFSADGTIYLAYGESILKLRLGNDFRPKEIKRMLLPEGLNLSLVRMEAESASTLFLIETKVGRIWLTQNQGQSWSRREVGVPANDIKLANGNVIWVAGTDSKLYKSEDAGRAWQPGMSSGIRWLLRLEPGPHGEILAAGGTTHQATFDTVSLLGEGYYNLPASGKDFEAAFSSWDDSLYCTTGGKLYRFSLEEERWEEIVNLRGAITKITVSPQGIYLFANSQGYFSVFPLTPNSSWETLNPEARARWLGYQLTEIGEKENLLFFWDSSKITSYYHEVLEEAEEEMEEEVVPDPVSAAPPQAEPVSPEPVKPEPVKTEPAMTEAVEPETPEPLPSDALFPPKPTQEEPEKGSAALVVAVIILSLIVVFLLFIIFYLWRTYRYYV